MVNSDQHPAPEVVNLMGKYEIGRLLGRGAFAKVYRGRHLRTGQSVAIKAVSKKRLAKEGCAQDVIKREIAIMRRMRHPHIIRLQEVLATKTKIFFIMELANGGELFSKVAKGRFSEDLCRHYFHQLVSAVAHCHAHGIFHRDLKPENLLLDDNWNLKVTDFGLSAVRDQIHSDGMLHTMCGTPAYVAPEILAKKGYDGSKVDIWSCGVILFVLNAGYLPFNDQNLMVMYRKIYKGEFRCPKWTSPELKRFIRRLLDTNPKTRITVDEIIKDPWFQRPKDKEVELLINVDHHELYDFDAKEINEGGGGGGRGGGNCLNAFDIISFSSGFNLSGLVSEEAECEVERFVSVETAEVIMERVEEAAATAGVRMVSKMEWGGRLEGERGNFGAVIRIRRLTKELVVVEVKTREVDSEYSGNGSGGGIWKNILWPNLSGLIYRPDPLLPIA